MSARVANGCPLCAAPQKGIPVCEGHFVVRVVDHPAGYYAGHEGNPDGGGEYAATFGARPEAVLFFGRRARRDAELTANAPGGRGAEAVSWVVRVTHQTDLMKALQPEHPPIVRYYVCSYREAGIDYPAYDGRHERALRLDDRAAADRIAAAVGGEVIEA